MIISDLQFMVPVNTSEVKGGSGYGGYKGGYGGYYQKHRFAFADSSADAQAYGDQTFALTETYVIADADFGFSAASSDSTAIASTSSYVPYRYYYH